MAVEILADEASQLDGFIREEQRYAFDEAHRRNPSMLFHRVLWQGGIKIEVFSDEHPPPHFRLSHQNRTANFAIVDCELLNGDLKLPHRAVRKWWMIHRVQIAEAWNMYRPTDCPVGPIDLAELPW
jgi:hypothetical protein